MGVAPARSSSRGRHQDLFEKHRRRPDSNRRHLNPIRPPDGPNHGKKPHKSLVGRTICRTCLLEMPESAGLKRPNNRPNRHKNRHKAGNRGQVKPRPVS